MSNGPPKPTTDALVSVFENAKSTTPLESVAVGTVLESIKSGAYREQIESLRKLPKAEYDRLKKNLRAVVFTGKCSDRTKTPKENRRSKLLAPSNIWVVDLDGLSPNNIAGLRSQLSHDQHVCFFFLSPSGRGMKVGVRVDGNRHEDEIFAGAKAHFRNVYGQEIDEQCKDLLRLCFVSWDPDLFMRRFAQPLSLPPSTHSLAPSPLALSNPAPVLVAGVLCNCSGSGEGVGVSASGSAPVGISPELESKMLKACELGVNGSLKNNRASFIAACALANLLDVDDLVGLSKAEKDHMAELWHRAVKSAGRITQGKSKWHYINDMKSSIQSARRISHDNPLRKAWQAALDQPLPPEAMREDFVGDDRMQRFIAFCYQLHLLHGKGSWFMGRDKTGEVMGFNRYDTIKLLPDMFRYLVDVGILAVVAPADKENMKATEYRYVGLVPLQKVVK